MAMLPSAVSQLGVGADFGGDALTKQRQDQEEEERRRKKLGLSPLANGSASVQQLFGLGGMSGMGGSQFNIGGLR